MTDLHTDLYHYLKQEKELGMPDLIFSQGWVLNRAEQSNQQSREITCGDRVDGMQSGSAPVAPPRLPAETTVLPQESSGRKTVKPIRNLSALAGVQATPAAQAQQSPLTPQAKESKRELLKELYYSVYNCQQCVLAKTRKKTVFGAGSAFAPVLVIGEAPGSDEDAQGLPFVGKAGKLLTDMLKAINLDREKGVFITNVLKCRPPENRNPESAEVVTCLPILKKQIEIIAPRVILVLGKVAAASLLNRVEAMSRLRHESLSYNGIPVIATYHPAALLRNTRYKRPAWEDLQKLQQLLVEMGHYAKTIS